MIGYGNSMFLATHGILARSGGGGGIDPDAQAFITAASITNPTQQGAINTLVVSLKGYGIWTKFKAIYPIVGGSASSHKFNLKDPRDLDAAFRLTFATGWTHSTNGMTPLNTFANTFLAPSANLSLNSTHIASYLRTNLQFAGPIISTEDASSYNNGLYIWPWQSSNQYSVRINDNGSSGVGAAPADIRGLHIAIRTAVNVKKYRLNNTQLFNSTESSTGLNTSSIYLSASRNNANYNGNQIAFSSIGDGLTDTESANFYTAVQAFQTTLGRSIGTQTVSDADAQAFINAAAIDDQVQANAINNLVIGLKADGLWSKMNAIYPIVGGSASSHAVNLKTPGTYNLTFATGWTHSSTGMTPNGATYASTGINVNSVMSLNSMAFGIYSRTNSGGSATSHGAGAANQDSCFIVERWTDNVSYAQVNTTTNTSLAVTNSSGFYQVSRTASNAVRLVRNTTHATSTAASTAKPNLNFLFGARSTDLSNNTFQNSQRQLAFGYLADGLSQTECDNFYNRVNTYQTTLNRNV